MGMLQRRVSPTSAFATEPEAKEGETTKGAARVRRRQCKDTRACSKLAQELLRLWHHARVDRHSQRVVGPVSVRQLLWRSEAAQLARHKDADLVAQHFSLLHRVRRQDDGAVLLRLENRLPQLMARGGVESSGGLVEIHNQRVADEADGHAQAPLHAA